MTDKRISELDAAGALTGDELVEIVQDGVNVRSTVGDVGGGTGFGSGWDWTADPVELTLKSPASLHNYVTLDDDVSTGVSISIDGGNFDAELSLTNAIASLIGPAINVGANTGDMNVQVDAGNLAIHTDTAGRTITLKSDSVVLADHANGTAGLVTVAGKLRLQTSQTPASAAAAGVQGTIAWDSSFIYVCVATNTWKRVAIATW